MSHNTDYFFEDGKLSFVMDGGAGSSGKSILSAYLVKHSTKPKFLVSSFTPNASHTICDDDGSEFVYKIFAGGSQYHEKLDAIYIVDGSALELSTLWKEIDHLKIPRDKVRISPRCAIVQQIDKDFEAGLCDLDGNYYPKGEEGAGTVATGSTCSGSGTVLAKKVVRNKTLVVAKDVPALADMLYDMDEIISRLECGQAGLFEIAQGFPLSNNHHRFAPHTTSRNVTVTAALNDAMLPTKYAGNVFLNWRTFPIKIHSKKYKCVKTGNFLTWDEVVSRDSIEYEVIESYSGDFYDDQKEISWEEVTELSGGAEKLLEVTTLTKLPRRIATFSKTNLKEAILFNNTGANIFMCINFMNYAVASVKDKRCHIGELDEDSQRMVYSWLDENILSTLAHFSWANVQLRYIGTGKRIDDKIRL